MCNLFDESCLKVISKFNNKTPKSITDIVGDFDSKAEIADLELYGDSLAHYVSDLAVYGYLIKDNNGYILSERGENMLHDLETNCRKKAA